MRVIILISLIVLSAEIKSQNLNGFWIGEIYSSNLKKHKLVKISNSMIFLIGNDLTSIVDTLLIDSSFLKKSNGTNYGQLMIEDQDNFCVGYPPQESEHGGCYSFVRIQKTYVNCSDEILEKFDDTAHTWYFVKDGNLYYLSFSEPSMNESSEIQFEEFYIKSIDSDYFIISKNKIDNSPIIQIKEITDTEIEIYSKMKEKKFVLFPLKI